MAVPKSGIRALEMNNITKNGTFTKECRALYRYFDTGCLFHVQGVSVSTSSDSLVLGSNPR